IKVLSCLCQEDTEGEIKREQTQEQRTEKDSMYELSAKNDRLMWHRRLYCCVHQRQNGSTDSELPQMGEVISDR
ncbi:hypothetical protein, partial [Eubacterium ramulus]